MAYRMHDLRGVLDPRTTILAGPFRAQAGDMLNAGWEFHHRVDETYHDMMVLARNPRSGLVAKSYIDRGYMMRDMAHRVPEYLYFGEDLVLTTEFYRHIEMPKMELQPMDIGHTVPIGPYDHEMIIFDANVNKEDRPQELIIMPEDIPMLMDKIIKAQEPRAKKILADNRKREGLGELQMKAKILTFGKSA